MVPPQRACETFQRNQKGCKLIKWQGVAFTKHVMSNMSISAFIDLNLETVDATERNYFMKLTR